jgi:excisionase family DNA binding protein
MKDDDKPITDPGLIEYLERNMAEMLGEAYVPPPAPPETLTFSIDEAAELAGVARDTLFRLAKNGRLPGAVRLGKRWVVNRQKFLAYLQAGPPAT